MNAKRKSEKPIHHPSPRELEHEFNRLEELGPGEKAKKEKEERDSKPKKQ
ncbi:hypothetical protein ISR92_00700 [Patescibacteria group bacterium]|nr:hypothetical protein [Patescibacteria group bacterium]